MGQNLMVAHLFDVHSRLFCGFMPLVASCHCILPKEEFQLWGGLPCFLSVTRGRYVGNVLGGESPNVLDHAYLLASCWCDVEVVWCIGHVHNVRCQWVMGDMCCAFYVNVNYGYLILRYQPYPECTVIQPFWPLAWV